MVSPGNFTMQGAGYTNQYGGPTYSVKYLGIVDGAMGILSRKMAMQGEKKGDAASAADMVKVNKKLTNPYN
jgi:hypothetical protein